MISIYEEKMNVYYEVYMNSNMNESPWYFILLNNNVLHIIKGTNQIININKKHVKRIIYIIWKRL